MLRREKLSHGRDELSVTVHLTRQLGGTAAQVTEATKHGGQDCVVVSVLVAYVHNEAGNLL